MELFCFSPTGNSRRAAEIARQVCGESPLFLAVFPVHAQDLPDLARARLEALPPMSGPACILCTYGGISPGGALAAAARILTKKGLRVIAAAELPDRHSYDRADSSLTVPRRWTEGELADFLARCVQKAASGGGAVRLPRRLAVGQLFPQRLLARLGTRYPAADPALCTRCGRCEACCPAGAAFQNPKSCIRCAACVDVCPVSARALRFRTPVTRWYLRRGVRKPKAPAFYSHRG